MEVILPEIYLREGTVLHGEKSYGLIRTALSNYLRSQECKSLNIGEIDDIVNDVKIEVYKEGKPYFANFDVEFSVSNTGPMWMCLFDRKPCGIDIQEVKSCKHESIAGRHFSKAEFEYVKFWGEEGFFDIWTAKEAFGKYTGKGLFASKESVVGENHELKQSLVYEGKKVYIKRIDILPEIKCTYCLETEEDAKVVLI